jgi:hypothetical protein
MEPNMILETSQDVIRAKIRPLLAECLHSGRTREDIALQIIEIIAIRMTAREDYQVATVGAFVRINLTSLAKRRISFCQVLERFTTAAAHARLAHVALVETLKVS